MGFTTLSSGLTIKVPTDGTTNYGPTLLSDTWQKISEHDHTGSGKGLAIATTAIANGAVTADKLAANAVTTAKIADGNVTAAKLDVGAIAGSAIALSWTDYSGTITIAGVSPITYSASSTVTAYTVISDIVYMYVITAGTTGGSDSNKLTFTIPHEAKGGGSQWFAGMITGAAEVAAIGFVDAGTTDAYIMAYDGSNLGVGASRGFAVNFWYRKA